MRDRPLRGHSAATTIEVRMRERRCFVVCSCVQPVSDCRSFGVSVCCQSVSEFLSFVFCCLLMLSTCFRMSVVPFVLVCSPLRLGPTARHCLAHVIRSIIETGNRAWVWGWKPPTDTLGDRHPDTPMNTRTRRGESNSLTVHSVSHSR